MKTRYNDWVTRAGEEFLVKLFTDPELAESLGDYKIDTIVDAALEVSRREVDDDNNIIPLEIEKEKVRERSGN